MLNSYIQNIFFVASLLASVLFLRKLFEIYNSKSRAVALRANNNLR